MKRVYFLILTLPLMLLTSGCGKEECSDCFEEKVSCYVNGEYWEDCCDNCESVFGGRRHIDCSHRVGSNNLIIEAGSSCNSKDIFGGNLTIVSTTLQSSSTLTHNTTRLSSQKLCGAMRIDTLLDNFILIESIDEENQRIKGTFSFLGEDECGEKVSISEGKFHIKFHLP